MDEKLIKDLKTLAGNFLDGKEVIDIFVRYFENTQLSTEARLFCYRVINEWEVNRVDFENKIQEINSYDYQ